MQGGRIRVNRVKRLMVSLTMGLILPMWAGCAHDQHLATHSHAVGAADHSHPDELIRDSQSHAGSIDEVHVAPTHAELHDTSHDPNAACTCVEARLTNGWCRRHGHGFVAGLTIPSGQFFEALDTHGHDLGTTASFKCQTCREARASDGFCATHQWGFDNEKLYATPVGWTLARGRADGFATDACVTCRANSGHHGWCEACGVGHVGATRFASRADYDRAVHQQDRLKDAMVTLKRCEECAIRTFSGGTCWHCGTESRTLPGSRYFENLPQKEQ